MTTRWTSRAIAPLLIAAVASLTGHAAAQNSTTKAEPPKQSAAPAPSTGHEGHKMPASKGPRDMGTPATITGEVMDPACFLEAGPKSIGPGHYQCAIDCVRSGQTLAIYDRENDRIYFIAGELPGKNPNEPLLPYLHKKVDVTGVVFHRASAYGIRINKVALHQEKPSAQR